MLTAEINRRAAGITTYILRAEYVLFGQYYVGRGYDESFYIGYLSETLYKGPVNFSDFGSSHRILTRSDNNEYRIQTTINTDTKTATSSKGATINYTIIESYFPLESYYATGANQINPFYGAYNWVSSGRINPIQNNDIFILSNDAIVRAYLSRTGIVVQTVNPYVDSNGNTAYTVTATSSPYGYQDKPVAAEIGGPPRVQATFVKSTFNNSTQQTVTTWQISAYSGPIADGAVYNPTTKRYDVVYGTLKPGQIYTITEGMGNIPGGYTNTRAPVGNFVSDMFWVDGAGVEYDKAITSSSLTFPEDVNATNPVASLYDGDLQINNQGQVSVKGSAFFNPWLSLSNFKNANQQRLGFLDRWIRPASLYTSAQLQRNGALLLSPTLSPPFPNE